MSEPLRWRAWTLRFYVPEGREAPSFETIDAFLTALPGIRRQAPYTGMFYVYDHRETGVRGSFRYDIATQVAATEDLAEALEEEPPPDAPGWAPVPLEFLAALGAATWYAWETMPLVARACQGLGLAVLDHHRLLGEPRAAPEEELIALWARANVGVLARVADAPKDRRLYLPPDRARAVWEYLRDRPRIEQEVGPRVRVPEVSFFPERERAIAVCPWAAGEPSVFPRVDRVAVRRRRGGLFGLGGTTEDGWVAREELDRVLGARLAPRGAWSVYDAPRMDHAVRKGIASLPLVPIDWRDRVDPGAVVDVLARP